MSPAPIAVILPFRNARSWIAETLLGLAAEVDVNWQLIAIDDGSTDGSAELLQKMSKHWPADRLRLLQGGGHGVSQARNLGIAATDAPLLAFLDADDRPLPGRLQLPMAALAADPGLAHAHGGWWRVDAAGALLACVQPWCEGAGFDRVAALTHKAVLPSAWTIRRYALDAVGAFDPTLTHAEDVDLMLRLACAGQRGVWIEKPLVRYRVHAGSASRNLKAQIDALAGVVDRHLQGLPPEQAPWAAGLRYGTLTWGAWKAWSEGDQALALQVLRQAAAACPVPLPRRPVHFLEHLSRSCAREGMPFDRGSVLASPFWCAARKLLLTPGR